MDTHNDGFRLYIKENGEWRGHEVNAYHAYAWSTPFPVNVGHNENGLFQVLRPGESWECIREVTEFPKISAPGDEFRYAFKPAKLQWWDWGDFQDHTDTVVWIDVDQLHSPRDNDGRPAIIIPGDNWVEFTLTE